MNKAIISPILSERLQRIFQATPEQWASIDLILARPAGECGKASPRLATNPAQVDGHPDGYLTKADLAKRLRVTVRTIENWQHRGVLPFIKIGKMVLFQWDDVVAHLKSNFRVCRRTCLD